MFTVLLAGPGGNWLGLLIPLILLVLVLKGGSLLYNRFIEWYANRKDSNKNIVRRKVS